VRDRGLFAGDRRNEVRLPAYARLDTRVQRTFLAASFRVTLFAEMLNILNRANQGFADGIVQNPTGQAAGFTRSMLARRAAAGFVIDF
jgi:outer membrane receptor for Fe3+-dicitrate